MRPHCRHCLRHPPHGFRARLQSHGSLCFTSHGQFALSVPVGKLQEAFRKCQLEGAIVDWNRAYRLLVAAVSRAGHLHLELPSDGRTLSWSALARAHAGVVLARDPSHLFFADAMESLVAELTGFSRARNVHSHTLSAALQVPDGPHFGPAPPSELHDVDVSHTYRARSNLTWCQSPECRGRSIPASWVCDNRAYLALKNDTWVCSK